MTIIDSMLHKLTQSLGRSNTVNAERVMERIDNDIKQSVTKVKNKDVNVNRDSEIKKEIDSSFRKLCVLENKAMVKRYSIKPTSGKNLRRLVKHQDTIERIKEFKNKFNLVTGNLIDTNTQSSIPTKSSPQVSPRSAARKAEEDFSTLTKGRTTYAAPRPRPVKGLVDTSISTRTNTPLSLAPGSSLNVAEPRNGAGIFMANKKAEDDFTAFTQERAAKMVEDDSTVLDKEILKAKEHILSFKKDLEAKKEKLEGLGNSLQDSSEEKELKEGIDNITRQISNLEYFITNFKSGNASPRSVALDYNDRLQPAPENGSVGSFDASALKSLPFSEQLMDKKSESNLAPAQKEKPPVPPKPAHLAPAQKEKPLVPPKPAHLKRGAVSQSPMSDKQVTNFSSRFEFKLVAALPDPVATSAALEKFQESTRYEEKGTTYALPRRMKG